MQPVGAVSILRPLPESRAFSAREPWLTERGTGPKLKLDSPVARGHQNARAGLLPARDDLGGRQPAETALAILSEIVAERYGASGRPMREKAAAEATTRVAIEGTPVTAG